MKDFLEKTALVFRGGTFFMNHPEPQAVIDKNAGTIRINHALRKYPSFNGNTEGHVWDKVGNDIFSYIIPENRDKFKENLDLLKKQFSDGEMNIELLEKVVWADKNSGYYADFVIRPIIKKSFGLGKPKIIGFDIFGRNFSRAYKRDEIANFVDRMLHTLGGIAEGLESFQRIKSQSAKGLEIIKKRDGERANLKELDSFKKIFSEISKTPENMKEMQQKLKRYFNFFREFQNGSLNNRKKFVVNATVIEEMFRFYQEIIIKENVFSTHKNVTLEIRSDIKTRRQIEANLADLEDVFTNIMINSLQHAKEGVNPQIKIEISYEANKGKDYFKIVVSDNGKGIEPKLLELISKTLKEGKGETVPSTRESGAGAGTALIGKIIKDHQGIAQIISSTDGTYQGTTYFIYLPEKN